MMDTLTNIAMLITTLGGNFGQSIIGSQIPLVGEAMGIFLAWTLTLLLLKGVMSIIIKKVLFSR